MNQILRCFFGPIQSLQRESIMRFSIAIRHTGVCRFLALSVHIRRLSYDIHSRYVFIFLFLVSNAFGLSTDLRVLVGVRTLREAFRTNPAPLSSQREVMVPSYDQKYEK